MRIVNFKIFILFFLKCWGFRIIEISEGLNIAALQTNVQTHLLNALEDYVTYEENSLSKRNDKYADPSFDFISFCREQVKIFFEEKPYLFLWSFFFAFMVLLKHVATERNWTYDLVVNRHGYFYVRAKKRLVLLINCLALISLVNATERKPELLQNKGAIHFLQGRSGLGNTALRWTKGSEHSALCLPDFWPERITLVTEILKYGVWERGLVFAEVNNVGFVNLDRVPAFFRDPWNLFLKELLISDESFTFISKFGYNWTGACNVRWTRCDVIINCS